MYLDWFSLNGDGGGDGGRGDIYNVASQVCLAKFK